MSMDDIFSEFEEKGEKKTEKKPVEEKPAEAPKKEEKKAKEETPPQEASPEELFGEPVVEEKKVEKAIASEAIEAAEFFEEAEKEEAPAPKPKPTVPTKEETFDTSEDKGTGKEVYMIYGLKGEGKTGLAFSFPGKIVCLSFDRKSLPVKQKMFKDREIKVYDANRYMDSTSAEVHLEASEKSFRYLNTLFDHINKNWDPDWIVLDGSEILQQMCEMTMRYRNNLMPFQGIANLNLWKERRMYIRQVHRRALDIAKKGVIYTTYTDKDEVVKDGQFVTKKDVPKWIDVIMYETDCVIKVEANREKTGQRFFATVESSKASLPTGVRKDVTDVGLKAFFEKA